MKIAYQGFIPEEVQSLEPSEVRKIFPEPTLIFIEGLKKRPLFVSFLLHGNETSSFFVLQKLQRHLKQHRLGRSLILFIGNVCAAEKNMRFIEGQSDFNRIWKSSDSKEAQIAKKVLAFAKDKGPLFASVDIHNNTGFNPHYSCISRLDDATLYLASLFAKTIVYFKSPKGAQSVAFSDFCPAVTLECGRPGDSEGIEKSFNLLLDLIHSESLEHSSTKNSIEVFQTVGRIEISKNIHYDFGGDQAELVFPENLEMKNFSPFKAGDKFADYKGSSAPWQVLSDSKENIFDDFFEIKNTSILTKCDFVPAMLTSNKKIIEQDCLGYIMKSRKL